MSQRKLYSIPRLMGYLIATPIRKSELERLSVVHPFWDFPSPHQAFFSHPEKTQLQKNSDFFAVKLNSDRPNLRYSFFSRVTFLYPFIPAKLGTKFP